MASVSSDPNGSRRIMFVNGDGERKTVYPGPISLRAAERISMRIEHILTAKTTGEALDSATALWLAELEPTMANKLARVGLIPKREDQATLTLGAFLTAYMAKRGDVKPATHTNWKQTERSLLAFFGADRPVKSITAGDASDFERWLKTAAARGNRAGDKPADSGLAGNTLRKRISNAKQFFQDAVARDLLAKNPFAGLKGAVGSNRERDFFITHAMAQTILDACPDGEWRLIFALSRFGGLRCPSEHQALRWGDVDWEHNRMTIHSPKTEHHEGKATRLVPLFPELRQYLEDAFDAAEPGAEHVITRYRDGNNLRTQLERIIRKAGLKPWPKLFQNLRASRATDLANAYPAHVAAAWLGHSTLIANKHYWQVTDADFERAVKATAAASAEPTQNPTRKAPARGENALQGESAAQEKAPVLQGLPGDCSMLHKSLVGPV